MAVPGDPAGRKCTRRGPRRSFLAASSQLPRSFLDVFRGTKNTIKKYIDSYMNFGSILVPKINAFWDDFSIQFQSAF